MDISIIDIVSSIVKLLIRLAVSLAIAALMVIYVIQPVKFEGASMSPALNNGDRLFVLKNFWTPARGDIVAFRFPLEPSKSYIKRIVGLPGEIVEIRDARVLINGNALEEPYVDQRLNTATRNSAPITIPKKHYYILGDNRDHSSDSRYWGTVSEDLIYGKYLLRYMKGNSLAIEGTVVH